MVFADIIVVTDGIVDFPDINVLDVLLSSLRTHTVSVSFIRVACQQRSLFECDFGHICNVDLMEFIARTTTGAYVEYQPRLVREPGFNDVRLLVSVASHVRLITSQMIQWAYTAIRVTKCRRGRFVLQPAVINVLARSALRLRSFRFSGRN